MIGGNDVRTAAAANTTTLIGTGVTAEIAAVNKLIADGAKHILVSGVGDVGGIPESKQRNDAATATADSILYNTNLVAGLAGISNPNTDLDFFDFFTFSANVALTLGQQGFDTTDPCFVNTTSAIPGLANPAAPFGTTTQCGPNAQNINNFLFWDNIHPTAPVQAAWERGLEATVPEPESLALFGVGLVGLAAVRRRKVA
jgi:phospholipase/lecithinase/hemolysin